MIRVPAGSSSTAARFAGTLDEDAPRFIITTNSPLVPSTISTAMPIATIFSARNVPSPIRVVPPCLFPRHRWA